MEFSELIAPLGVDRFMAEYYGRAPLHIPAPAGSERHKLMSWPRLNALLGVLPHWTERNLKVIMNSRAVGTEFYTEEHYSGGPRADPAKLDLFLAMGASLVADSIHEIAPEVRQVVELLSVTFGGRATANLYCSFRDVQAFATHYDTHEVFALHCEGEKLWRLYENRADAPVGGPDPAPDAQQRIDRERGPTLFEARLHPGDLLYIPRGWYHDALASSEASLHLSFGVMPLYGRILFSLLEPEAMADPAFRAYLPDSRLHGGGPLREQLAELADRLATLARSPKLEAAVALKQRELRERNYTFTLPDRLRLEWYARTDRPAAIEAADGSDGLSTSSGRWQLDGLAEAARWLLSRAAFSLQELFARYPHESPDALRGLVKLMHEAELFLPYQPKA